MTKVVEGAEAVTAAQRPTEVAVIAVVATAVAEIGPVRPRAPLAEAAADLPRLGHPIAIEAAAPMQSGPRTVTEVPAARMQSDLRIAEAPMQSGRRIAIEVSGAPM